MKDFHYVIEKGEVGAADYYEKKRETVLETIKPICEAFEIADFNYEIKDTSWEKKGSDLFWRGGRLEILWVEGTGIDCTCNSIAATVRTLVNYIAQRL